MVLNLYPALLSFFLGVGFGLPFEWLYNNYRRLMRFVVYIIAIWLLVEGIRSIFNPDTLLRQTYSDLQGWVDFVFGFAGVLLGCYLENRYERNRKFKIIIHKPRQAPAYIHGEKPKVFGEIRIVPEKHKEGENEELVMGGLHKHVLDSFLKMPQKEQELLVNSTVKAVGELRLFQYQIANTESILDLLGELNKLSETAVKVIEKKEHGGIEERFQLWLSEAKLSLIELRLEEISKIRKNKDGVMTD